MRTARFKDKSKLLVVDELWANEAVDVGDAALAEHLVDVVEVLLGPSEVWRLSVSEKDFRHAHRVEMDESPPLISREKFVFAPDSASTRKRPEDPTDIEHCQHTSQSICLLAHAVGAKIRWDSSADRPA